MRRIALLIALTGCFTEKQKQLLEYIDRQAKDIRAQGCPAESRKTRMLTTATGAMHEVAGKPEKPLLADEKNPGPTDERIVGAAAEDVKQEGSGGWLMIGATILSLVVGGSIGKKILDFAGAYRQRGRSKDALSQTILSLVDRFKGILPKDKKQEAGEIVREAAREFHTEETVQAAFEERKRNGGQA